VAVFRDRTVEKDRSTELLKPFCKGESAEISSSPDACSAGNTSVGGVVLVLQSQGPPQLSHMVVPERGTTPQSLGLHSFRRCDCQ